MRRQTQPPAVKLARFLGHLPVQMPAKSRLVEWLNNRYGPGNDDFEVEFHGWRYRGSLADVIDWNVFYNGSFETHILRLLRDMARRQRALGLRPILYDIGANVGHHTLFMAGLVDRVYAFEPFGPVRQRLVQKVKLNGLSNVDVIPFGLGRKNEQGFFFPPAGYNRGSGSFIPDIIGNRPASVSTAVVQGDRLCRDMGLLPPTIIKIDVEGSERRVLEGLRETLATHRPVIACELGSAARKEFGDQETLLASLYPDAVIWTIAARRIPITYALTPFEFDGASDFLAVPAEAWPSLRAGLKPLRAVLRTFGHPTATRAE